jgi:hypothetical protein
MPFRQTVDMSLTLLVISAGVIAKTAAQSICPHTGRNPHISPG